MKRERKPAERRCKLTTRGRKFRQIALIPALVSVFAFAQTAKRNEHFGTAQNAQASTPQITRARRPRIGGGFRNVASLYRKEASR